jgi:uncharacterized protein YkwD
MARQTIRFAAVVLVALAILGSTPGSSDARTSGDLAHATLRLLNEVREAHGLSSLRLNGQLSEAARGHSRDMVTRRYFSHVTPEGLNFADRIRSTGYLRTNRRWLVGETLAWGWQHRGAPARIVRAWLGSPPHREVMLNPAYREVGIGVVTGVPRALPRGGATYTADFGVKR